MKSAVVLAYHVIFGTYGFWLPNDPRGSWSDFVGSWELSLSGLATKTDTRISVARAPHNRQNREDAKRSLKHPAVHLSGRQALAAARGFEKAGTEGDYSFHACSILPEHVHLVIGRHDRTIGRIVGHLKARATQELKAEKLWDDIDRPVWAKSCWKVFLNDFDHVQRAIRYVEQNPIKDGKRRQVWSFVMPFESPTI